MNIMAFDSSAKVASVAICSENKILSEFNVDNGLTHSQTLMPMAEQALKCARLNLSDVDAFAVSVGPGSFTGLRIGISAVKGLAQALDKPCIGVSTLESLIGNLKGFSGIGCAVMDARRNQVYNCLFRLGQNPERLCDDRAISAEDLAEELKKFNENIILVGDGADLCYNIFGDNLPFVGISPPHLKKQRASSVAGCAFEMLSCNKQLTAYDLMPKYIRLSQAERQYNKNK